MTGPSHDNREEEIPASPQNAAWAVVALPLAAPQLLAFLSDIERLFRLNPYLEIAEWQELRAGQSYRVKRLNEMNGARGDLALRIQSLPDLTGIRVTYEHGLKLATEFKVDTAPDGSLLTVTEHYRPVADESDPRLGEIDRSLIPWAASIRSHVRGLARFGGIPGYLWCSEHLMLGLPPRQRRMVRLLVWVSILEFAVFLAVVAVVWLER